MRSINLLHLTLMLAAAPLFSCAARANKGNSMTQARLEATETKLARISERLEILETKTGNLDGVGEGVQLLLQRLDQLGAQGAGSGARSEPSPTATYSLPIEGDPFLGPKDAKVTLVQGYDFYCSFCDKVRPTLTELQKRYGKDLKIVFKNFVIHDEIARLPALAACAAHQQGKFMPMFEQIWVQGIRARNTLDEPQLLAIAKNLKLKDKKFRADMHGLCEDKITLDFNLMTAVGAKGTPAFFINGRFLSGALPIEKYERIIDQELTKADNAIKSGIKLEDYYASLVASGRKGL